MNIGTQSTARERTQKPGKATLGLRTTAANTIGETRHKMIAEAAYFLAQQRCFADGHAMEDWLKAEARINAILTSINARR